MLTTPRDAIGTILPTESLPPNFFEDMRAGKYSHEVELSSTTPMLCKDGRPTVDGPVNGISLPGGSLALVVVTAYLLDEAGVEFDFFDVINSVVESSLAYDFPLGVHRAEGAAESGCGAADALATVLNETDQHGDSIRTLAKALDVDYLDEKITVGTTIPSGEEIISHFEQLGVPSRVLVGDHHERAVVLNLYPDGLLDRVKMAAEFGADFEVFCLTIWALPHAAEVILDAVVRLAPQVDLENWVWDHCGEEYGAFEQAQAALVTLSLAVAMTLCGPGIPVIAVTPESVEGA